MASHMTVVHDDNFGEDRRKYLEFIQTAIARMSAASSLAKGWCLTVATAALGFAVTKSSRSIALLALLASVLFATLDARYLREERKFRALYEGARLRTVALYDMQTSAYVEKGNARFDERCRWFCILRSWALWGFYGPLLAVSGAVLLRTLTIDR